MNSVVIIKGVNTRNDLDSVPPGIESVVVKLYCDLDWIQNYNPIFHKMTSEGSELVILKS